MITRIFYLVVNLPCSSVVMDRETFLRQLGDQVVKLRSEKNWSQSDLARAAEMERQNIHRLEHGNINPSIYFLKLIADALEVPLSQLVSF